MATQLETAVAALFAIEVPDPNHPPDDVYQAVGDVIAARGSDDIADLVAGGVESGKISVQQAQTFVGVASWSGTDNGHSMQHTLNTWFRNADDALRIGLALHHDTYPLPTRVEMVAVLTQIARRFPEHRAQCEDLIAHRPSDS